MTTIYNTQSLPPPFLILEPNPNSFEQLLRQHRKQLPVSQLLQQSNLIDYKLQLTEKELRKVCFFSCCYLFKNFKANTENNLFLEYTCLFWTNETMELSFISR